MPPSLCAACGDPRGVAAEFDELDDERDAFGQSAVSVSEYWMKADPQLWLGLFAWNWTREEVGRILGWGVIEPWQLRTLHTVGRERVSSW